LDGSAYLLGVRLFLGRGEGVERVAMSLEASGRARFAARVGLEDDVVSDDSDFVDSVY
jgi:hypothetical protein